MGWTSTYREPGITDADYFASPRHTIHAHATIRNVFYAAVSRNDKPEEVFAWVFLLKRYPRDAMGYNFTWKEMDDTCGPVEHHAPLKVLDLLTPTSSRHAQDWRARCYAAHARRAWIKEVVQPGTRVRFASAMTFGDDVTSQDFQYSPMGRRTNVFVRDDGRPVQITDWRDRKFEVIA